MSMNMSRRNMSKRNMSKSRSGNKRSRKSMSKGRRGRSRSKSRSECHLVVQFVEPNKTSGGRYLGKISLVGVSPWTISSISEEVVTNRKIKGKLFSQFNQLRNYNIPTINHPFNTQYKCNTFYSDYYGRRNSCSSNKSSSSSSKTVVVDQQEQC